MLYAIISTVTMLKKKSEGKISGTFFYRTEEVRHTFNVDDAFIRIIDHTRNDYVMLLQHKKMWRRSYLKMCLMLFRETGGGQPENYLRSIRRHLKGPSGFLLHTLIVIPLQIHHSRCRKYNLSCPSGSSTDLIEFLACVV